jgi:hypothetical protein
MQSPVVLTLIFIVLCGHPRYETRAAATRALHQLVDLYPAAVLAGERSAVPEIAERCRLVLNGYFVRHAAELAQALEPAIGWPWCDSLSLSCTDETGALMGLDWDRERWNLHDRQRFLTLAQQQGYPPGHPWNAWREASRLWVEELVSQRRDVAYFLRAMCEGHLQQCRHYGFGPRHGLPPRVELIAAPRGEGVPIER